MTVLVLGLGVPLLDAMGTIGMGIAWLVAQTAVALALCIMAFAQIFFSFGCRSDRSTLVELGLFTNPALFGAVAVSGLLQLGVVTLPFARPVLNIAANPMREWVLIFALALAPITLIELAKVIRSAFRRKRSETDAAAS